MIGLFVRKHMTNIRNLWMSARFGCLDSRMSAPDGHSNHRFMEICARLGSGRNGPRLGAGAVFS